MAPASSSEAGTLAKSRSTAETATMARRPRTPPST
jgi:hypothetical protein